MIEFFCENCKEPATSKFYEIQNPSYYDNSDIKKLQVCRSCALELSFKLCMIYGHAAMKCTWDDASLAIKENSETMVKPKLLTVIK